MISTRRKALVFFGGAVASVAAATLLVPREGVAEMTDSLPLERLFPAQFASWRVDPDIVPLEVGAELRKVLAEAYDQTLARTYVDAAGYRVMLSVAYGGRRNQGMDIHRPEICYPAQGFALRSDTRETTFQDGGDVLPLKRLVAGSGARNEPISYWLVVGDGVASFGYGHRIALLKYGLTGHVPDGMLIRLSSIDDSAEASYAAQDVFLHQLLAALAPDFRRRVMGLG